MEQDEQFSQWDSQFLNAVDQMLQNYSTTNNHTGHDSATIDQDSFSPMDDECLSKIDQMLQENQSQLQCMYNFVFIEAINKHKMFSLFLK